MDEPRVFHPSRSKYIVFTADYLLPILICLGVLALIYISLYSPFFKITKVDCSLDFTSCDNPGVLAELEKLKGKNIFTISPSDITSRLTSGDFTIRQASLRRALPGIITVDLQSVYPVVALRTEADSSWVVMDSKYRVIGVRSQDPNVPTVVVDGPLTLAVGKKPTDAVIIQALDIAGRLANELFSVKTITLVDEGTIKLSLPNGRSALFTTKKDELLQLRALQAILADATILKGIRTIDVRFAQPVLR